jgi:hypothetical protein
LQALEAVTNETDRELKASHLAAGEGRQSAEHLGLSLRSLRR